MLLLGTGYGTFEALSPVSCPHCGIAVCPGCEISQVGTGDFNRDGELDLVFATDQGTLVVLPGIGNGKFRAPIVSSGIENAGGGLVVGDFNGDGLLDIVTDDSEGQFETELGNGNGTFRAGPTFSAGIFELAPLSAADFRNDGRLDLVWADAGNFPLEGCGNSTLWVARGNGDGSFQPPEAYEPGYGTGQSLIGDYNGDGRPDILAVNFQSNSIGVLLNNGKGEFEPALDFRTPAVDGMNANGVWGGIGALVGDVNGDGKADVILPFSNGVGVLLAQSGGTFHAPPSLELFSGPIAPPTAPVDVNHDGIPDILMLTDEGDTCREDIGSDGILPVLSSKGVALSTLSNYAGDSYGAFSIGTGYFTRNGNVDAAVIGGNYFSSSNSIAVSLNDGKGNFTAASGNGPSTSAMILAVGDFNRDGISDLAMLVGNTVQIRLGKGGNSFSSPVAYAVGDHPVAITVRDLKEDGKQDLVVVNKGSDSVSVLLGNGNGTFQNQKVFQVGESPVALTLADFNRDGKVDVAVANENNVSVLLGTGTGSFGAAKTYAAGPGLLSIAAIDLHQNGLADVLAGASNGNLILLSGLGNGTLAPPQQYAAGGAWFIDVADFNGDGAPDVVIPGPVGYAVSVLYNQGGTRVTLTSNAKTLVLGETVTFTAKVAAAVTRAVSPSGTVAFYDGLKGYRNGKSDTRNRNHFGCKPH